MDIFDTTARGRRFVIGYTKNWTLVLWNIDPIPSYPGENWSSLPIMPDQAKKLHWAVGMLINRHCFDVETEKVKSMIYRLPDGIRIRYEISIRYVVAPSEAVGSGAHVVINKVGLNHMNKVWGRKK